MKMKQVILSHQDILFCSHLANVSRRFSQLLGNRSFKAELLIGAMTIWGVLMLISRVRLGMHYPIDLFVAIISAWIVHLIIFSFLQKKGLFNNK